MLMTDFAIIIAGEEIPHVQSLPMPQIAALFLPVEAAIATFFCIACQTQQPLADKRLKGGRWKSARCVTCLTRAKKAHKTGESQGPSLYSDYSLRPSGIDRYQNPEASDLPDYIVQAFNESKEVDRGA